MGGEVTNQRVQQQPSPPPPHTSTQLQGGRVSSAQGCPAATWGPPDQSFCAHYCPLQLVLPTAARAILLNFPWTSLFPCLKMPTESPTSWNKIQILPQELQGPSFPLSLIPRLQAPPCYAFLSNLNGTSPESSLCLEGCTQLSPGLALLLCEA